MTKMYRFLLLLLFISGVFTLVVSDDETTIKKLPDFTVSGRKLIEQGRTLVHHAVKRFMIILPAIFFKLGIAFTLLIIVTLVAVNNGFIGFLLLVVGMSSVLARLQENRRPAIIQSAPYISPLPPYHSHWDRNDNGVGQQGVVTSQPYSGVSQQYYASYPGYYAKGVGKL